MLNNEDVQKIAKAHQELFYTKNDMDGKFEELRGNFSKLQTAVESFAVGTNKNLEELIIVNNRIQNHEDWIRRAGPKIGLDFKS